MSQHRNIDSRRRREGGTALLIAVMLLTLLGAIGLASLDTVSVDRQATGYRVRATLALEAADAGVATALGTLRADLGEIRDSGLAGVAAYDPDFPTVLLGDATSFPHGRPFFQADPSVADAISYMGRAEMCDWTLSLDEDTVWQKTLWDLRVQGQTADGTTARVQSVAGLCRPYNINY